METANVKRFRFAGFTADCHRRELLDADGVSVSLSPRAFDALIYFLERAGRIVERREMLEALWPNTIVEENSLSQLVMALRRALGDGFIVTVPRRGYQFVAEVQPVSSDEASSTEKPGTRAAGFEMASAGAAGIGAAGTDAASTVAASKVAESGRPAPAPSPNRAWLAGIAVVTGLAAALLAGAFVLREGSSGRETDSVPKVAVLPCDSIGPDAADAYVAAGIHEEILNRLAQVPGLRVVARTSVLQYAQDRPPIGAIARELDASAVVECSVRHAGEGIIVDIQQIDPASEARVWAGSYDGNVANLEGLFAMQADIAINIAAELGRRLSPSERAELAELSTSSPEAYAAYLQALQPLESEDSAQALSLLDEAIRHDPEFARAYATRGIVRLGRVLQAEAKPATPFDAAQELQLAWADADAALALDASLGLAYFVLASRYAIAEQDTSAADDMLKRAAELSPNDSFLLYLTAGIRVGRLELDEAHALLERVGEIDPNYAGLDWMLFVSGDAERSLAQSRRRIQWNPTDWRTRYGVATSEMILGNISGAVRQLRIADQLAANANPAELSTNWNSVYGYGRLGLARDAELAFAEVMNHEESQTPVDWMFHYLGIGDRESALEWASRVAERPLPPYASIEHVFALNSVRDPVLEEPEFAELRRALRASAAD